MQLALVSGGQDRTPTSREGTARQPQNRPSGSIPARYEVGAVVGRGGMGEVVVARDHQIGRDVAIKRLHLPRPSDRTTYRFLREAHVQGRLDHPAIVPVHELGHDSDGVPYFVMKKLTGATLAAILRQSDRPLQRLLRAFADICLAVEFAHTRGVVHRDLKPMNLVLGDFGEIYVLDWGIAKILGEDDDGEFSDVIGRPGVGTSVGAMIGTLGYMAPEQVQGRPDIDAKVDVYSLGCVLFEIIAGAPLHVPQTAADTTLALAEGRPSAFGVDDVPPELDDLCARATARDRTRRPTARELAEGVQRFLDGDRDLMLRRRLAEDHLARAREVISNPAERATAMREAASALALDPMLDGAAELLGRLMLEPPRDMPVEVKAEMARASSFTNQSQARIAMWIFLGYFGFTPFLLGYGGTHVWAVLYAAYLVVNVLIIRYRAHGSTRFLVSNPVALALRNAILIAVIAHVFSPLLLAPGLAAVTTSALLISPVFSRPRDIAVLLAAMVGAIALPWLAEATGVVTRTLTITDTGAILHNPEISGDAVMRGIGWTAYTVGLVAAGIAIAYYVRRTERDSRDRLHLQAWHLRALVPHSSRGRDTSPAA